MEIPPVGTLYLWWNLDDLPQPLNNGLVRPLTFLPFLPLFSLLTDFAGFTLLTFNHGRNDQADLDSASSRIMVISSTTQVVSRCSCVRRPLPRIKVTPFETDLRKPHHGYLE